MSGGRPGVGALAGGSLTPLDPPHHTGGLYFAWLRPKIFRALRARVFSYIRGLSNGVREVLIAKGAYNTAHIMSRWTHGCHYHCCKQVIHASCHMPLSVLVNDTVSIYVSTCALLENSSHHGNIQCNNGGTRESDSATAMCVQYTRDGCTNHTIT